MPDMVVTDCQMPRLNGLALIERIRSHEETKHLPVFMLTGKGFELSQQEVVERLGVLGIIGKPFSPRELLLRINEALRGVTAGAV